MKGRNVSHGMAGLAAVALALCAAAPSIGSAAVPGKRDCSAAGTVYDRLACKQQALIAQQELLVGGFEGTVVQEVLLSRNLKNTHDKLVGDMRGQHARAKGADLRTQPKHFKDAVKRQKRTAPASDCALRPLEDAAGEQVGDLNRNGICDGTEACASAGDFTRQCRSDAKPGNKFECARICPEAGVALPEPLAPADVEEDEIAEGLLASYDEMEGTLIEMNQAMEGLPPAAPPLALAAAADPCADVSQPPAALETTARVLKIADIALEGAAKIADKLCGQTVVAVAVAAGFGGGGGGNTSAVCTVIETASAIASGASTVVEIALEFLRDDMQAATFACLQDTISKVGKVQTTVEESGAALLQEIADARAALEAQTAAAEQRVRSDIEAARAEWRAQYLDLVLLLSTPQGLRPDFPVVPGGK